MKQWASDSIELNGDLGEKRVTKEEEKHSNLTHILDKITFKQPGNRIELYEVMRHKAHYSVLVNRATHTI